MRLWCGPKAWGRASSAGPAGGHGVGAGLGGGRRGKRRLCARAGVWRRKGLLTNARFLASRPEDILLRAVRWQRAVEDELSRSFLCLTLAAILARVEQPQLWTLAVDCGCAALVALCRLQLVLAHRRAHADKDANARSLARLRPTLGFRRALARAVIRPEFCGRRGRCPLPRGESLTILLRGAHLSEGVLLTAGGGGHGRPRSWRKRRLGATGTASRRASICRPWLCL
jgi:hypothetical protein